MPEKITTYDKLVRDKIPEILADSGIKATFRIACKDEYISYLEKKLDEEVAEFHESKSVEELIDIYEVIIALAGVENDTDELKFRHDRTKKLQDRGGFSRRIILIETEENS